jgi:hypothetical protein
MAGVRPGKAVVLEQAFLALLRETGNARASARLLGCRHEFANRVQRDPAFRAACRAAAAEAEARLKHVEGPFLGGAEPALAGAGSDASPPGPLEDEEAERTAVLLRPGEKPRQSQPQLVVRRTSNGRTQISFAHEGHWTAALEADFLARLRETGNFERSARALGFHPTTLHRRLEKWPAFRKAVDEALDASSTRLEYRLFAHAHELLGTAPGEQAPDEAEESAPGPIDPQSAMRILTFLESRRAGRTSRGPRGSIPQRSFEEARENILRKIEAIERWEGRQAARAVPPTPPPPSDGLEAGSPQP